MVKCHRINNIIREAAKKKIGFRKPKVTPNNPQLQRVRHERKIHKKEYDQAICTGNHTAIKELKDNNWAPSNKSEQEEQKILHDKQESKGKRRQRVSTNKNYYQANQVKDRFHDNRKEEVCKFI